MRCGELKGLVSKPTKHFDIGISGSCFGSRPRLMVLMLFANSERVGAGTCPRLNLGAYFLLGILNEQFFVDDLHGVDMVHERHPRRRPCRRRPRAAALSTATLAAALAADALSRDARCWLLSRDARCWLPI